jgi:hypothetical protein
VVKTPKRGHNPWWILVVIVIAGAMLGSVLANAVGQFTYLSWFGRSLMVGVTPPVVIDLHVLTVTVGVLVRLNLAVLLGILIAAYVFRML